MSNNNKYNSLILNSQRLNELSMDGDRTGIETMAENMNKSSNIVVSSIVKDGNTVTLIKPEYEPLPSTQITLIPNRVEVANKKNDLASKIDTLSDKSKGQIIFGLLGLSIILLVIIIIK